MQPGSINEGPAKIKPASSPIVPNGELKVSPSVPKDIKKGTLTSTRDSVETLIPELRNMKVSQTTNASLDIIRNDFIELDNDKRMVMIEEIVAEKCSTARTTLKEAVQDPEVLNDVINEAQKNKRINEVILIPLKKFITDQLEGAQDYIAELLENSDPILSLSEHVETRCDKVILAILDAELLVKVPAQIFNGVSLIHRKVIVERAKKLLVQVNNNELANFTSEKKKKLESFIKEQSAVVREGALDLAVEFGTYVPKATQTVIKTLTKITDASPVLLFIGMGTAISWIATSAWDLWKSAKAKSLFTSWKSKQKESVNYFPPSRIAIQKASEAPARKQAINADFSTFMTDLRPNNSQIRTKFRDVGINIEKARDFVRYLGDGPLPENPEELDVILSDHYAEFDKPKEKSDQVPPKMVSTRELTQLWGHPAFKHAIHFQYSQNQSQMHFALEQLLQKRLKAHENARFVAAEDFNKNIDVFLERNIDTFLELDRLQMNLNNPFEMALSLLSSQNIELSKVEKFKQFLETPAPNGENEKRAYFNKGIALLKSDLQDFFMKSKGLDFTKAKRFMEYVQNQVIPDNPLEKSGFLSEALHVWRRHENQASVVDDKPISADQLRQLFTNEAFRFSLLDQHTDYKQSMTVETRLALKSLAEKKLETERKFFNFKLGSAATYFSMSTLAAAASITLKVLAVAGIVAATSAALALPGLGLLVGGVILVGVGLIFLYKYKPNLFTGILKGTAIKLAFQEIPLAFYNFRMHRAKSDQDKKTAYVNFLSARIAEVDQLKLARDVQPGDMSKDLASLLDSLKENAEKEALGLERDPRNNFDAAREVLKREFDIFEKKKIESDRKVDNIEITLKKFKKKADDLKAELADRGTQDFLKAAGYFSKDKKKQKNRLIDAPERIAMSLMDGNLDDETKEIFLKRMGIDLNKMAADHGTDDAMKVAVTKAMKAYFGMGREEMEKFMDKMGLRETVSPAA